jgi:hypothetical protein
MDDAATTATIGNAWVRYLQSIQEAQQESQRQYQQLWSDFVEAVQSARSGVRDEAAEAYRTYVQDVSAAYSSSDAQQAAVSAYQKYVDAVQEIQSSGEREAIQASQAPDSAARSLEAVRNIWLDPERTRKVSDAYNDYNDAVKKWSTDLQDRLTQANQKYASSLTQTLGQDDAAATARAAYQKYVAGVSGTYRQAVEQAQSSAQDAAESVEKAAKKRSK